MSDLLYYLKSEMLESELEAAKLREAEQANALEIARTALKKIESGTIDHYGVNVSRKALTKIESPSAALAERDRETGKRTAERCVAIAAGCYYAETATGYIRREFKLEPKPEDEVNG